MKKTATCLTNEMVKMLEEIYEILEKLLDGKDYIATNCVTIADFSVITTLTTMNVRTLNVRCIFEKVRSFMEDEQDALFKIMTSNIADF